MLRGYARVSTSGQDLSIQRAELTAAGCTKIYAEKISGVKTTRPMLERLKGDLLPGDVVVVTRLDRLARSALDLLHTVNAIAKCGSEFRSLADTWCDTTTPHGKLILTVLAGIAEFERSLIKSRTDAGIQRARDLGKTFGRPTKLTEKQRYLIAERRGRGETIEAIAKTFGVGVATVYRALAAPG